MKKNITFEHSHTKCLVREQVQGILCRYSSKTKPDFSFQLTFDTFTVGKFVSFTSDGCPDGHMTIVERSPSPPTGQWCGSAWGYTVYFSESDSINMTLRLDRLSQQVSFFFNFIDLRGKYYYPAH